MANNDLQTRMRTYENVTRTHLTRRMPVIIRLDGKAFHTFTKRFDKPFDAVLSQAMYETTLYLCKNISGCVLGYTQSDEITLVLCDYKTTSSQAWFNNNVQKMCSVSASMATMAFNATFAKIVNDMMQTDTGNFTPEKTQRIAAYNAAIKNGAMFDSRVFNIPKEEVNNCLLWRQQDATRNSIEALAQAHFSHNELQNLNCNQLQELLWQKKNINWNDIPVPYKRGVCCIRVALEKETPNGTVTRNIWMIDCDIPIFSQNTNYVNDRITFV